MNQIDPAFQARSKQAFMSNAPLSLAGLRDRVAELDSGITRRTELSALNSVGRLFGRDLASVRATPRIVRELFASKTAAQLNISGKRLANIRSSVVAAMSDHGEAPQPITKRIPLLAAWDELLGQIDVKTYKMALYRLASYCSFIGISPDQVNAAILVSMYEALETEEIVKNPRLILKHTIAIWNMCHRQVPGWPDVVLARPSRPRPYRFRWRRFPRASGTISIAGSVA